MPKLSGFEPVPIPGPPPSRILGHVPALWRFLDDPPAELERLRAHGDVVALSRDNPAFVCVFGPERNREVLSNPECFRNDEEFVRGRPGTPLARISTAIININGELHKRHRRLMMPAFSKSALEGYAQDIVRVAEQQVGSWPIGEVVDLDARMRRIALGVAMQTLLGVELGHDADEIGDLLTAWIDALGSPLAILLPYQLPGLPYRRAQQLGGQVLAVLDDLIERKRQHGQHELDALARLVHAVDEDGTRFSDEELVAEATTLFFAGHDTMAKTMSWTLLLLERHPKVFADVLDELDGVVGGRSVCTDDIPRLPLLDRVIKETMRVASSVPLLFLRVPANDVALGSVRLPKHANVVVSPYATHHDGNLYPQPRRFDPARWIGLKPATYAYLPFGAGPRSCIGGSFANQALRLVLATVLQRTRPAIVRGAKLSRITRANIMRLRYGMPARLHPAGTRDLQPEPVTGNLHSFLDLQ